MFQQLVPLSTQHHRSLKFSPQSSYLFARNMALIPLVSSELNLVAREMPIVFPPGSSLPHALVGVKPDENLHVHTTGAWAGRYVPAHVRRYPFMLGFVAQEQENSDSTSCVIQIDSTAPHFIHEAGEAFFDDAGRPTAFMLKIQQILVFLQRDIDVTRKQVQLLDDLELLSEQLVEIHCHKENIRLNGLRLIDQQKMRELSGDELWQIQQENVLNMAFAHFISLTNLTDGWLSKQLQATRQSSSSSNIEELFGSKDDMFKFS